MTKTMFDQHRILKLNKNMIKTKLRLDTNSLDCIEEETKAKRMSVIIQNKP